MHPGPVDGRGRSGEGDGRVGLPCGGAAKWVRLEKRGLGYAERGKRISLLGTGEAGFLGGAADGAALGRFFGGRGRLGLGGLGLGAGVSGCAGDGDD